MGSIKTALRWIVSGPPPKPPKISKDCLVLHKVAALELSLYEEVLSLSIKEHLRGCKRYRVVRTPTEYRVEKRLPVPPKGPGGASPLPRPCNHLREVPCDHKFAMVIDQHSGKATLICDKCGIDLQNNLKREAEPSDHRYIYPV